MSEPQPVTDVDGDDDGLLPVDRHGDVDEEYVWACKHCPATKPYNPDDPDEDYDDEDWEPACSFCNGACVINDEICPDCGGTGLE